MPITNATNGPAFQGSFNARDNNGKINVIDLPSGVALLSGNGTQSVKLGIGKGTLDLATNQSAGGAITVYDYASGLINFVPKGNTLTFAGGSGPFLLNAGMSTIPADIAPFSGSFQAMAINGNMTVNPSSLPLGVTLVNGSNNSPVVELKDGSGTLYLENVSGIMTTYDEGLAGYINVGASGNTMKIAPGIGTGTSTSPINGYNGHVSFYTNGVSASSKLPLNSSVSPLRVNQNGAFGPGWIPEGPPGNSNITSYKNVFGFSGAQINEFQEPSGPVFNMVGAPSGLNISITAGPSNLYSFTRISGPLPSEPNILTPSKNPVYFNWSGTIIGSQSGLNATASLYSISGSLIHYTGVPANYLIPSGANQAQLGLSYPLGFKYNGAVWLAASEVGADSGSRPHVQVDGQTYYGPSGIDAVPQSGFAPQSFYVGKLGGGYVQLLNTNTD